MTVQNIVALEPVPNTTRVRLQNFDINQATLKIEHQNFLRSQIIPILRAGGSLRLIGLASRTGGYDLNNRLSQARRDAVLRFLLTQISTVELRIALSDAQGERAAALAGVRDERETPEWRSVIVSAWNRPIPPPEDRIPVPIAESRSRIVATETDEFDKTWIGIGEKQGLSAGFVGMDLPNGFEQATGVIWNMGDRRAVGINVTSRRYGIGLGAGLGAVIFLVFNAPNIRRLNGMVLDSDWAFNVSVGENLGAIFRSVVGEARYITTISRILYRYRNSGRIGDAAMRGIHNADLDNLRNLGSQFWTATHDVQDIHRAANKPQIIVLDIPVISAGVELSFSILRGTTVTVEPLTDQVVSSDAAQFLNR